MRHQNTTIKSKADDGQTAAYFPDYVLLYLRVLCYVGCSEGLNYLSNSIACLCGIRLALELARIVPSSSNIVFILLYL